MSVVKEIRAGAKWSLQLGWIRKRKRKLSKSSKMMENPKIEKFACLSCEACEDRGKFRNSS
jgi:hypothetical protein